MASLFARCTPGTYDALETAAKGMMHAQLACALLGTCGWQGTGYLAGVAAMSCFGLVAIETGKSGLLKVRERRGERRSGFELNGRREATRRDANGRLTAADFDARRAVHGGELLVHALARHHMDGVVRDG
jgi:hypothetical protein